MIAYSQSVFERLAIYRLTSTHYKGFAVMKIRSLLPLAPALTAVLMSIACATAVQKNMQTWVGSTESQLLQSWGAPDRTQELADGSKVDTWINTWNSSSGQRYQCRKTFTIASNGEIIKWSYTGCPKHLWEH